MDVFIPLATSQKNENRELRFALRSLEKNMTDLGKVFIAGDLPSWLVGVEHLKIDDIEGDAKMSVQKKLLSFCKVMDASEDFLFTHDDIFTLQKFDGENLPFYGKEKGVGNINKPIDCAVHTPVRYNKTMYQSLFEQPDNNKVTSPRSFYLNFYNAPITPHPLNLLYTSFINSDTREILEHSSFFTVTEREAGRDSFIKFMEELYPEKSRFEI